MDQYLDLLMRANNEGRVEPGQFSARADQILAATTTEELDAAVANLRPVPVVGYQPAPMPYLPPPVPAAPPRQVRQPSRGWNKQNVFIVAGSALFMVMAIFAVGNRIYNPVPPNGYDTTSDTVYYEEPAEAGALNGSLFVAANSTSYLQTDSIFGRIVVTADSVDLELKEFGNPWQRMVFNVDGTSSASSLDIKSVEWTTENLFDGTEYDPNVWPGIAADAISNGYIDGEISKMVVERPKADGPVQITVHGTGKASATYNAATATLISRDS